MERFQLVWWNKQETINLGSLPIAKVLIWICHVNNLTALRKQSLRIGQF